MNEVIDILEGYKKTKVGVIPNNWSLIHLSEACVINGEYGINAPSVEYNENLPTYLRITDIDDNGNFLSSDRRSLNHPKSEKYILKDGDIVFARTGATVGKTYLHKSNLNGELVFAGFLIRFRTNSERLIPYYLKLFSESYQYWNWVKITSQRSGQPGINGKEYSNLHIPLPPLPEQQKIASILTTWDKAIGHTQGIIENLRLRNKGLAQQLLTGKTRLKGFDKTWEEFKLSDISERVTTRNSELNDTVVTISAQRGFVLQEEFFNKRVASETLSNYYLLQKGEYAYNKSYSKGYPMGAFKCLNHLEKAVVTTLYICFRLKDNVNSNFMEQFFEAGLMIKELMRIAQEGGRAHGLLNIGLSDFFNLKLTIPYPEEQYAIANVLEKASQELNVYEKKLTTLQEQKKGLMQKLLTGEIRVNV